LLVAVALTRTDWVAVVAEAAADAACGLGEAVFDDVQPAATAARHIKQHTIAARCFELTTI
jgi:hypothetical protein